ncbi:MULTISPECIES: EAL domain-containing protein [unclassified Roseitalea]|uniref:putative bifunctional diguanylate cyclase/phosphodiesterase n=1 Tax=unclassified Roseitalea TaxID=2639107 RepID=UPI00273DE934|nr:MULTISPECIES: EAL domain-containing protein [unclassified Roseitalea]
MADSDRSPIGDQAETEIFLSFVDSLFADRRNMLMGLTLQVAIAICVYIESGVPVMGLWPIVFLAANAFRLYHLIRYNTERAGAARLPINARARWAIGWERRYIVSSGLVGLAVGLFAWFCLEFVATEFAIIASLSTVFAALPTIVGRLYGSVKLAAIMTVITLLAPAVSLAMRGDPAGMIAVLLFVPYVTLILSMVRNVRSTVVSAVRGRLETADIAERFDVALNNMSHGLIMFDANERVQVMNRRARVLLQIPQYVRMERRSFALLLRYARRFELVAPSRGRSLQRTVGRLMSSDGDKAQIRLTNGTYIEFSGSQRPEGGSVLILEDVTERVRTQEKIKAMARFDGLTELPNRNHFSQEVNKRLEEADPDGSCILIAFDVDDFKRVNDSIGHAQGDSLLRAIARRMQRHYGNLGLLSRLGGDEFMVFIDRLHPDRELEAFAEEFRICMSQSYRIGPEQVFVTQSIGLTQMRACDFDLQEAMVRADLALYHSKAAGKGVWSVFEDGMNERYLRRQLIKGELAKAIDGNHLSVLYQPIVEADTGRIVACEALSRWHHEDLGTISPGEYIPLAEEMGIITKLTESMLRRAVNDCAGWPAHIDVSVNLSPIDFRRDGINKVVRDSLADAKLSPKRLDLEITESAVISNEADMIARLNRLRETGVRVSLDDFGTGYSSLSYLHRLPLDRVKIDRSFVAGLDSGETPLALLDGIADLCYGLGLKVTVEGVENESQLGLIRKSGKIDRVQGYLFGPALPASAIVEMATRTPPQRYRMPDFADPAEPSGAAVAPPAPADAGARR